MTPEHGSLLPALAALPGHLVWRATSRVNAALGEVLPPGLDIHGYAVLLALAGRTPRSQQDLARMVAISRTTVSKVATALVAAGLVERVRNPADRRSYLLTRTPEGSAAARRWRRHAEDLEDAITATFTLRERDELRTLLARVLEGDLAPDTPDALLDSTGFLVSRAQFLMHREFAPALAELGIEPMHFGALVALTALGPVPQADLARALGVSAAHVVQVVDDLEERGIVVRRRPASDRRSQVLHLQEPAAPLHDAAVDVARRIGEARFAGLDPAERERAMALLVRFVTAP